MSEDAFILELRALIKKYYPDYTNSEISIKAPNHNFKAKEEKK